VGSDDVRRKKTHDEVGVLDIGVALEFERELVEVPNAHLGLVRASGDGVVAVSGALDAVARLWKVEVLHEFYGTLDVLASRTFAFGLGGAFPYEPFVQGRGRACCGTIDSVDFDIDCCDHRVESENKIETNIFRGALDYDT
jgi:hypothetical protein